MREQAVQEISKMTGQEAKFIPLVLARESLLTANTVPQLQRAMLELQFEDKHIREHALSTATRLIELCKEAVQLGLIKTGEFLDQYYDRVFETKNSSKKEQPAKPLPTLNITSVLNDHCETLERKLVIWRAACQQTCSKGSNTPSEWKRMYLMNSWSGDYNRTRLWQCLPKGQTIVPMSHYNADKYLAELQAAGVLPGGDPKKLPAYRLLSKAYRLEVRSEAVLRTSMSEEDAQQKIESWWQQRHEKYISAEPSTARHARLKRLIEAQGGALPYLERAHVEISDEVRRTFATTFLSQLPSHSDGSAATLLGWRGQREQAERAGKDSSLAGTTSANDTFGPLNLGEEDVKRTEVYFQKIVNALEKRAEQASANLMVLDDTYQQIEARARDATRTLQAIGNAHHTKLQENISVLMSQLHELEHKAEEYKSAIAQPDHWRNSRSEWELVGRTLLLAAERARKQLAILEPLLEERSKWVKRTAENLAEVSQNRARGPFRNIVAKHAQVARAVEDSLQDYVDELREAKAAYTNWQNQALEGTRTSSKNSSSDVQDAQGALRFLIDSAKTERELWSKDYAEIIVKKHEELRVLWAGLERLADERSAIKHFETMVGVEHVLESVGRRGAYLRNLVRPFEAERDPQEALESIGSTAADNDRSIKDVSGDYIFEDGVWRAYIDTPERKILRPKLVQLTDLRLPPEPVHYVPEIEPGHQDIQKAFDVLADLGQYFSIFEGFDVLAALPYQSTDTSTVAPGSTAIDANSTGLEERLPDQDLLDVRKLESISGNKVESNDAVLSEDISSLVNSDELPEFSDLVSIHDSNTRETGEQKSNVAISSLTNASRENDGSELSPGKSSDAAPQSEKSSEDLAIAALLEQDLRDGTPWTPVQLRESIHVPPDIFQKGGSLFGDELTLSPLPNGSAILSLTMMLDPEASKIRDLPSIVEVTIPSELASSPEGVSLCTHLVRTYATYRDVIQAIPLEHTFFSDLLAMGEVRRLENFKLQGIGDYGDGYLDLRLAKGAILKDVLANEPGTVVRLKGTSLDLINVELEGAILDVSLADAHWRNCHSTPETVIRGFLGKSVFDALSTIRWDATRADLSAIEIQGTDLQYRLRGMLFTRERLDSALASALSLRGLSDLEWLEEQKRLSSNLGKYRLIHLIGALSDTIVHNPDSPSEETPRYPTLRRRGLSERYELKLATKASNCTMSLFIADSDDLQPCQLVMTPLVASGRKKEAQSSWHVWGQSVVFYHEALFRMFDLFDDSILHWSEQLRDGYGRNIPSKEFKEARGICQVTAD